MYDEDIFAKPPFWFATIATETALVHAGETGFIIACAKGVAEKRYKFQKLPSKKIV